MPATFDINCDMGEGFGNWRMSDDEALLPLISTANVACGFHAGDPVIMMNLVAGARTAGVAVGAHPGLPDLLGFGRRVMAVTAQDVAAYFTYQIGALSGFLRAAPRSTGPSPNHSASRPSDVAFGYAPRRIPTSNTATRDRSSSNATSAASRRT
jgi:lactam utilization protein B